MDIKQNNGVTVLFKHENKIYRNSHKIAEYFKSRFRLQSTEST